MRALVVDNEFRRMTGLTAAVEKVRSIGKKKPAGMLAGGFSWWREKGAIEG